MNWERRRPFPVGHSRDHMSPFFTQGTLFKYGSLPSHVAFKSSPPRNHHHHVIAIGGLTDGLLFAGYLVPLATALHHDPASPCCLVQPLLTSSHQGWGLGSVSRDADELFLLAKELKSNHHSRGIVIVGQSTGCQDAVMYARKYGTDEEAPPLLGVVLQAPVSDREYLGTLPTTPSALSKAQALVDAGRSDDVAFRAMDFDGAAIAATRWLSLAGKGGEDDMFSSDLSDDELKAQLGCLRDINTLLLLSADDEYVPKHVDYVGLGNRMVRAVGDGGKVQMAVEGGNHGLSEHPQEAADIISTFILDSCIHK